MSWQQRPEQWSGTLGRPRPAPPQARPAYDGVGWRQPPRRRSATVVLEVLAVGVGAVGVLWILGQVVTVGGPGMTVVAGVLAVLPLLAVLATIAWVDRWEPEPRGTLLAALLWGAGVATGVSLVLNDAFAMLVYAGTGSTELATTLGAVVAAPVVEESAKGAGVLLIFLVRRRYFDGPVDGVVYAATVAAGFAFVENVLYFVQYADALVQTFVVRAVQSPFAHLLFTACIGVALGVAARSRNRAAWVGLFPLGWLAAVVLHAVWNGSAAFGVHSTVYLLFQVPFFLAVIGLVLWLRARERRAITRRLQEYASAGWFVPQEVAMLASLDARRSARAWASGQGRGRAMRDFQRAATDLALLREREMTGRAHVRHGDDEEHLLSALAAARSAFTGR